MKLTQHAKSRFGNKGRQANAIETKMYGMIKAYGFDLVSYVARKIIDKETAKLQLEYEIKKKEAELERLKKKKS